MISYTIISVINIFLWSVNKKKFVCYLISNIVKKNIDIVLSEKKIKISYVPHVLSAIVKATKMYRENIIEINSMKTIL